ncbi:hypothetical protein M9H77_32187 [Catharanthus roseus]|uniref:Uncharacterized protein n=1 Tax=Catharanthus roseus TaxID=4058 RepID=A0ACC0A263_CATRO|nr:hypothetical protein M9H77_32187 [Catharanthus roseus]
MTTEADDSAVPGVTLQLPFEMKTPRRHQQTRHCSRLVGGGPGDKGKEAHSCKKERRQPTLQGVTIGKEKKELREQEEETEELMGEEEAVQQLKRGETTKAEEEKSNTTAKAKSPKQQQKIPKRSCRNYI